jgi:hypothetical protein
MSEKEPVYDIYGESSPYSTATLERETERVKSETLQAFRSMGVRFPINSKRELLGAIRDDRPTSCRYRGRTVSLKELAGYLTDGDFPLATPAEAALALAAACPVVLESPEGAPDTRPF